MKCNKCQADCIKKGSQKNGKQKYYCKTCSRYQQGSYTYNGCHPQLNEQMMKLVKRGCGIREIAFIQGISPTTVLRRIRSIAGKIVPPVSFPMHGDYEMDEMYTRI